MKKPDKPKPKPKPKNSPTKKTTIPLRKSDLLTVDLEKKHATRIRMAIDKGDELTLYIDEYDILHIR
jgi:hypothetical protein